MIVTNLSCCMRGFRSAKTMSKTLDIEAILNGFGKSVKDFGLPTPPQHLLNDLNNKLLMEENNYKRELLMQEIAHSVPKLKSDQRRIYDLIMNAIIVLAVASSGIASLLLPEGRIAHSQFKVPLELTDESLCHIKNTQLGNLLAETDFIFWDEAPMNDRQLIDFIYDQETLKMPTAAALQDKAIVCPKNDTEDGDKRNRNALSDGILKHHEIPRISATRARTKGWITDHATAKCQSVRRFIQRYKNDCKIFNVEDYLGSIRSIGDLSDIRDAYQRKIEIENLDEKATSDNGVYDCEDHRQLDQPTYRYVFKATVTDATANAHFTFFTPAGDKIHFTFLTRKGAGEFIVDSILDEPLAIEGSNSE
ncbi:DNA helicase, partial [Tanacetum coccineum]